MKKTGFFWAVLLAALLLITCACAEESFFTITYHDPVLGLATGIQSKRPGEEVEIRRANGGKIGWVFAGGGLQRMLRRRPISPRTSIRWTPIWICTRCGGNPMIWARLRTAAGNTRSLPSRPTERMVMYVFRSQKAAFTV